MTFRLATFPRRRGRAIVFEAVALTGLLALTPLAGAAAQTGRVEGTVVNIQTGEAVPEARVIVLGTQWSALTDRRGRYSILEIPVDLYSIRVEASGFEVTVLEILVSHRILEHDRRAPEVQPTRVDIELRPLPWFTERQPARTQPTTAVRPGFGLGLSLGFQGLGGKANQSVGPGGSTDVFIRYGTPFGLFLHAGGRIGKFGIDSVSPSLTVLGFYIEPRLTLLKVSSRWAPFVAGQVSFTRETVRNDRAKFTAPGHVLGVGVGAIYRLNSQIVLEGGLSIGVAASGDYVFTGDAVSYRCIEEVERGTTLPESAIECGGFVPALPVFTCYAPFFMGDGVGCDTPDIHRVDSGRSGLWYRVKLGIQVELGSLESIVSQSPR